MNKSKTSRQTPAKKSAAQHRKVSKHKKGFTLIELLLSIGIIAVLAAIVIVAINPTKMLADARDAKRNSEINSLLNALGQYTIDENGYPCAPGGSPCVDSNWRMLGRQTTGCDEDALCGVTGLQTACIYLRSLTGAYLANLPSDPRYGSGDISSTNSKSLYVMRTEGNRVRVRACRPEGDGVTIDVKR